jgi:hypothetical protein
VALAAVVGTLGSVAVQEPPPPTVMSVQITTTTTLSPATAEPSDGDLLVSAEPTEACHDAYVGACVPVDVVDVDCRDADADGPYFVGPVTVVGDDVYELDPDGDGMACGAG